MKDSRKKPTPKKKAVKFVNWIWTGLDNIRDPVDSVVEPEPPFLAGAGAGAGKKRRLRLQLGKKQHF